MVKVLDLNLTAIDVGGSPAAAVGFGSLLGAALIIVILITNIVLVALKLTKTVNVDIYNFWYFAITAGFVQLLTGRCHGTSHTGNYRYRCHLHSTRLCGRKCTPVYGAGQGL